MLWQCNVHLWLTSGVYKGKTGILINWVFFLLLLYTTCQPTSTQHCYIMGCLQWRSPYFSFSYICNFGADSAESPTQDESTGWGWEWEWENGSVAPYIIREQSDRIGFLFRDITLSWRVGVCLESWAAYFGSSGEAKQLTYSTNVLCLSPNIL